MGDFPASTDTETGVLHTNQVIQYLPLEIKSVYQNIYKSI
jgi:hypothetical protein